MNLYLKHSKTERVIFTRMCSPADVGNMFKSYFLEKQGPHPSCRVNLDELWFTSGPNTYTVTLNPSYGFAQWDLDMYIGTDTKQQAIVSLEIKADGDDGFPSNCEIRSLNHNTGKLPGDVLLPNTDTFVCNLFTLLFHWGIRKIELRDVAKFATLGVEGKVEYLCCDGIIAWLGTGGPYMKWGFTPEWGGRDARMERAFESLGEDFVEFFKTCLRRDYNKTRALLNAEVDPRMREALIELLKVMEIACTSILYDAEGPISCDRGYMTLDWEENPDSIKPKNESTRRPDVECIDEEVCAFYEAGKVLYDFIGSYFKHHREEMPFEDFIKKKKESNPSILCNSRVKKFLLALLLNEYTKTGCTIHVENDCLVHFAVKDKRLTVVDLGCFDIGRRLHGMKVVKMRIAGNYDTMKVERVGETLIVTLKQTFRRSDEPADGNLTVDFKLPLDPKADVTTRLKHYRSP